MRKVSPLATYNRVLAHMKPDDNTSRIHKSELAYMAAGESKLLISLVEWSKVNEN